jgi:hypothetical protein
LRTRDTELQMALPRDKRLANVRGVFAINHALPASARSVGGTRR